MSALRDCPGSAAHVDTPCPPRMCWPRHPPAPWQSAWPSLPSLGMPLACAPSGARPSPSSPTQGPRAPPWPPRVWNRRVHAGQKLAPGTHSVLGNGRTSTIKLRQTMRSEAKKGVASLSNSRYSVLTRAGLQRSGSSPAYPGGHLGGSCALYGDVTLKVWSQHPRNRHVVMTATVVRRLGSVGCRLRG